MSFAKLFERRCLALLASLVLMLACHPSPPETDVIAVTDLGMIRITDLDEHILSLPEPRRSPPADQSLSEWRRQLLEALITQKALEAEARSEDLLETEEGQQLWTSRRDLILAEVMGARLVGEKVNVTEEDLRAFYDAYPEEFSHPRQIRLRHIFRRVERTAPPEVWEEARQETEGLLEQIRGGARFGSLAKLHSDSETATLDGLIGRMRRGQLDPIIEEILWNMGEGEISEVLRTPVGFQIFKVENHLEQFKMDFEDARTRLRRRLTREATEAAEEAVLHELVAASGATYDPDSIASLDDATVLFEFADDPLTVAGFWQHLQAIGFAAAREIPLRKQLDRAIYKRLCLWQAQDQELASEPEVKARLEREERDVLIALARQKRGQVIAAELDEEELLEFFADRQKRFQTPWLMHLRILARDFPEEGSWYAVFEELNHIAGKIRAGQQDFAAAAAELSSDFSAKDGGDVGFIRPDGLSDWAGPQAQRKVAKLPVGELSEPLLIERYNSNRLTYERVGYMLVRMEEVREPRPLPYEEIRDKLIEQYLEQSSELQARIRAEILASVNTKINLENL